MQDSVTVSVRIKPTSSSEIGSTLKVISKQPAVLLALDKCQTYHFDNVFEGDTKQRDVYDATVKSFVEKVKNGFNCTVFAYGQTGTGKTYTIGTNPDIGKDEDCGLISRALEDFFDCVNINSNEEVNIAISFIEIYNEKVFDLLIPGNNVPLPVKGFTVQGFKKITIHNIFDGLLFLRNGSKKRHIGETKQNANSSRSHAIFSIYCHSRNSEMERMAKLNLVDLAGCECVRKTGNQGASFYEGVNINKGLLSLGQVMTALSTNSSHVPYRQSVLTTILQDSLNRKNFISLIACISSNLEDFGEALQTLEFSTRVKKFRNKPEVNEIVQQFKNDNPNIYSNHIVRGLTPSKKSNAYSYETPFKKPRIALPVIQEPNQSANNSSASEISILTHPMFSSSMSSSTVSETPKNLSPLIKKYMNAMENSIINKLEDVIMNTLKRSKRTLNKEEHKENEINFSRRTTRKLSMSVANDASFESGKQTNSIIMNCSDSSFGKKLEDCRNNSSTPLSSPDETVTNDTESDSFIFKVPEAKNRIKSIAPTRNGVRPQKKNRDLQSKIQTKTKENINDEGCGDFVKKRRSVRIQMKKDGNVSIDEMVVNNVSRRRSVRIQNRVTVDGNSQEVIKSNGLRKNTHSPLYNRMEKNNVASKRLIQKSNMDSPMRHHTKQVLHILNNGTLRELANLHTIGTKTAENIFLYRKLKGRFKAVSDIADMPCWTKKKFDKFMAMNFIKI